MFDWFVDFISSSPLTYMLVVGAVALDAVFPVVPGETVVITAATLAVQGDLSVWLILPAAALGGFLGDNCSYFAGRYLGGWACRHLFRGDRGRDKLDWGRRMIGEHGGVLIVAARFIPGGRTATTFAAGTLDMAWRRFAVADAIGAVAWAAYATFLGYFGGETFKDSTWKALLVALGVAATVAGAIELGRRAKNRWDIDVDLRAWSGRGFRLAGELKRCFAAHNILTYASAVAFQLLIALVPLSLLFVVLLGMFGFDGVWKNQLGPFLHDRFTQPTYNAIDSAVERILSDPRSTWLAFAVFLTIWEVSGSVRASMGALNQIYEVDETRTFWRRFGVSFAIAVAVSVLILGAFVSVSLGPHFLDMIPGPLLVVVRWGLALVLLWAAILALLRFSPARHQPVRWVSAGSVLVIVSWAIASVLFRFYVENIASFKTALGTATSVLVLTGYLYTSSIIFLVGAQLDELVREEAVQEETPAQERLAA